MNLPSVKKNITDHRTILKVRRRIITYRIGGPNYANKANRNTFAESYEQIKI